MGLPARSVRATETVAGEEDAPSASLCIVCLASEEMFSDCDVVRLSGSGTTVRLKISRWQTEHCPPQLKERNLNIFGGEWAVGNAGTSARKFPMCSRCCALVSRIDELQVELENLFADFWSIVTRYRGAKLEGCETRDPVGDIVCPGVVDPLRVEPVSTSVAVERSDGSESQSCPSAVRNPESGFVKVDVDSLMGFPLHSEIKEAGQEVSCESDVGCELSPRETLVEDGDEAGAPDGRRRTQRRSRNFPCSVSRNGFTCKQASAQRLKRSCKTPEISCGEEMPCAQSEVDQIPARVESGSPICDVGSEEQSPAEKSDSKRKKFSCGACGRRFRDNWELKRHKPACKTGVGCSPATAGSPEADKEDGGKRGIYICDVCGESFARGCSLLTHRRYAHEVGQRRVPTGDLLRKYTCRLCQEGFDVKEKLSEHEEAAHEDALRFACSECDRKFLTNRKLNIHKQRHETAVCTICGLKLSGKDRLRDHVTKKHNKEKQWKCKECGEEFLYQTTLWRHQWKAHGWRKDRYEFPCPVCPKVLDSSRGLKMHKFSKHGVHEEGLEISTCDRCGKSFAKKKAYETHVRMHDGSRPHACPQPGCAYSAVVFVSLKGHLRTAHKRNVRRVFPEGGRDETVYAIVDVDEGAAETAGREETEVKAGV